MAVVIAVIAAVVSNPFQPTMALLIKKSNSNNIVLLFHFVSRFVIGYGLGYYGKGFFRAHLSNNHSVISSFRISVNIISTQQKELNNREYQRIR